MYSWFLIFRWSKEVQLVKLLFLGAWLPHTNCTIRCPVGLNLRNWRFSCSTKKAAGIVMALLSPNLMATDM